MTPETELVRVTDDSPSSGGNAAPSAQAPAAAPPPPVDPMVGVRAALDARFGEQSQAGQQTGEQQPQSGQSQQPVPTPQPDGTPASDQPPAAAEAAPDAVPEPAPPPESRLAKLFDLTPDDDGVRQAASVMSEWYQYDPLSYQAAAMAIYQTHAAQFAEWALQGKGIDAGKINEFLAWQKSGAALPQQAVASNFPEEPQPDADGNRWVYFADGTMLNLADETDKDRYEFRKLKHELEAGKAQTEAAAAKTEQEQAAQRAEVMQRTQQAAANATNYQFVNESLGFLNNLIEPALKELAPDDQLFGKMFAVYAREYIGELPAINDLGRKAEAYINAVTPATVERCVQLGYSAEQIRAECAKQVSQGRAAEYQTAMQQIVRREIATIKNQFLTEILRRNKAELAATSTQPVFPPGTRTVDVTTPPAPTNQPPRTRDEAFEQGRERVRAALSGLPSSR